MKAQVFKANSKESEKASFYSNSQCSNNSKRSNPNYYQSKAVNNYFDDNAKETCQDKIEKYSQKSKTSNNEKFPAINKGNRGNIMENPYNPGMLNNNIDMLI